MLLDICYLLISESRVGAYIYSNDFLNGCNGTNAWPCANRPGAVEGADS